MFKLLLTLFSLTLPLLASAENPKIKIGVIAPLTGTASSNGTTVKNSILLAQEDWDPDHRIDFIFEDDQLLPKNTVNAANKLLLSDNVKGLIVYGSPTSLAVNSIAEKCKTPMIALSVVKRVVDGYSYVTKLWVSSKIENDLVIKEATKRNYQNVFVVATLNEAMLALKENFIHSWGEKRTSSEDIAREETDFRSLVLKIISKKPDAIYNLLWAPQPGLFVKLLRENGYKGAIFGAHNLEDPNEIKNSAGALDDSWFVTGDDSKAGDYLGKYRLKYKVDPTAGGANAYDAAKLYIDAVHTDDINAFLHHVNNFHGAYGTYSASGENDYTIGARVKKIKNSAIISGDH